LLSVLAAFLPALRPVAIISPPFKVCYSPDHSWAYAYTVRCTYRWSNSPNGPLSVQSSAAQGLMLVKQAQCDGRCHERGCLRGSLCFRLTRRHRPVLPAQVAVIGDGCVETSVSARPHTG
jgi:hypothetical protein